MKSLLRSTAVLVLVATSAQEVTSQAVPDVISAQDNLQVFSSYLEATQLVDLLATSQGLTVYAPTDEAFSVLDPKYSDPEWNAHLSEIVLQHVALPDVPYFTADWVVGNTRRAYAGNSLVVSVAEDPNYQMNNISNVVTPNITADNGVIHIMDTVILPPSATDTFVDILELPIFSILNSLLDQAGLTETLAGGEAFTFFAPTDAAFEALGPDALANLQADTEALADVLLYHVVPGIYLNDEFETISELPTLEGNNLTVPFEGLQPGDFLVSNGVFRK